MDTTSLLRFDHNLGLFLVETDSGVFHFLCQLSFLLFAALRIQHHEDQIGRFTDSDDLATTTFTIGGTLNDTW